MYNDNIQDWLYLYSSCKQLRAVHILVSTACARLSPLYELYTNNGMVFESNKYNSTTDVILQIYKT